MLGAITWDVSPTLLELAGLEIRWYGVLFALGLIVLGPKIAERMWRHEGLKPEWLESLFLYVVIATVVGARLGHVFFYDFEHYMADPIKILYIWEGGLASHGGALGLIIALGLYSRRVTRRSLLWALDRLVVPTGLAAALIRLGNLMNSEIFGRATDLPWAFRFVRSAEYHRLVPDGVMGCHPTQIYEALAYLAIFALMMWLYWGRDMARRYEGLLSGVFLALVFGFRFVVEGIKNVQVDWELDMVASYGINMGQLLSVPFVIAGLWLALRAVRRGAPSYDTPTGKQGKA